MNKNLKKIAIVGLGYVGLPLAVEFGKIRSVCGFDVNYERINQLKDFVDVTNEVSADDLKLATSLTLTNEINDIEQCEIFIVTVPTPLYPDKRPNLNPLLTACRYISKILKTGDIVIFESTVYPGATEEDCVPVLEAGSGLKFNLDFFCGYSPERINPGDRYRRLPDINKIVSGSNSEVRDEVAALYSQIVKAEIFVASSIRVAEAAKIIENTQRDLNIALVNELSIIFEKMGIDTEEVLQAAETKWNFVSFRPGLVGGHCIGVDPYYLTYKSEMLGYKPRIITAGRRVNDGMPEHITNVLVRHMIRKSINVKHSKILILGASFKENCPDIRNSKVAELFTSLSQYSDHVDIFDPIVSHGDFYEEYQIGLVKAPVHGTYDAIVLAVAHSYFREMGVEAVRKFGRKPSVLFDLKYMFPSVATDLRA